MALEQLRAFREGRSQEELGPVERLEPEGFPILASSDLRHEHDLLTKVVFEGNTGDVLSVKDGPVARQALESTTTARTRLYLALIERAFAHDAKLSNRRDVYYHFFGYGPAAKLMALLFEAGVDAEQVVEPTLEWFNCYRFVYYGTEPVNCVVNWVKRHYAGQALPDSLRAKLAAVAGQFADLNYQYDHFREIEDALRGLIGSSLHEAIVPCEKWSSEAFAELERMSPSVQSGWIALLRHAQAATSARPSAKWLKTAHALAEKIGHRECRETLLRWFALVDGGRVCPMIGPSWDNVDERMRMHEVNATVLRGLLWICPALADDDVVRGIGKLAQSAYRKIRGIGPRATKVGNASIYALSSIGDEAAVGQLAMLKVKVRFGTAQKEIEKAFNAAAEKLNVPRDQIEEMGVPSYGLEAVGLHREAFGDYHAELAVSGSDADLRWSDSKGKSLKSVPSKVKQDQKEELKELQQSLKDIQAMLPAQRDRIDSMFLLQKTWPIAIWQERYLEHPLVGTIARRLIWNVDGAAAIFADGQPMNIDGKPLQHGATAEITLWHPVGQPIEVVTAWRRRLEELGITQPFKQAHREVYLLTDAERRTNTYSNRFAAHVIRQHQFNALCAARGWKNKLRLMVDDSFPPATKSLPLWGLRAEFWIEGIGQDYGSDTNESGVFLRLATDQVRFYRVDAATSYSHAGGGGYTTAAVGPGTQNINEPIPLAEVPPLVLSEIMRDVDLFVGVASVGNDPTWQDGGPQGRYLTYWQNYSFGELGESAKTRKAVLERLIPRLKIADKCTFSDKFLVVKGSIRTYKIHLGSGNILMEPNDQYLCIVPDARARAGEKDLFLPFEGDNTLSIILSKAFLLAEDSKIKDPTITRQIGG